MSARPLAIGSGQWMHADPDLGGLVELPGLVEVGRACIDLIVRGSARDAARIKAGVAAALTAGECVVVFPEGTTTDGCTLGRFYAALFQAAVDAGVPVQPVAIRYPLPDGAPNPAAAFIDEMTFVESLLRVARAPALAVRLTFGPRLPVASMSRRELAARARRLIAEALDLPAIAREREHVARHSGIGWAQGPAKGAAFAGATERSPRGESHGVPARGIREPGRRRQAAPRHPARAVEGRGGELHAQIRPRPVAHAERAPG